MVGVAKMLHPFIPPYDLTSFHRSYILTYAYRKRTRQIQ